MENSYLNYKLNIPFCSLSLRENKLLCPLARRQLAKLMHNFKCKTTASQRLCSALGSQQWVPEKQMASWSALKLEW